MPASKYDFNIEQGSSFRLSIIYKDDDNNIVKDMALEICKFSLNDPIFLNYRPSMVAACSLLISINIFENNSGKNLKFIENCRQNSGLRQLNLQIWNTQEVHLTTGYSIEEIKKCLYDLS